MGQFWSGPGPQPGQLHDAIQWNNINEIFRLLDAGISVSVHKSEIQFFHKELQCKGTIFC